MSEAVFGPNASIDIAQSQGADLVFFARALSSNSKEITLRLNATLKDCLQKGEIRGMEPTFLAAPDYPKGPRWYAALWAKVGQDSAKGSVLPLLLPIAVFLYDSYGLAPSKFLLDTEPKTTLPQWLQNWLAQVDELSSLEYNRLCDILDEGKPVRCDTIYTLKSRIAELAASRGVSTADFIMQSCFLSTDYTNTFEFSGATFRETGNSYLEMKPFLGNHKMLRLLICLCVRYQVSPEYLLLQDYSDFAVTEQGRYYPPATRQLISQLLQVDAATRTKAVGYVMAVTAAKVMAGESANIPAASPDNSDDTLNLMAAMTHTSTTRKETEAQLIESIKEKALQVLALSGEQVSSVKLYSLVEGHSRLVRKALTLLEAEGKIECIPMVRTAPHWRLAKKKNR